MALAQRLYEGLELGEEGAVGLITYMRTDSTRLSDDAVNEARDYIDDKLRQGVPARRADRLQDQEAGAGRPRGDPPHVDAVRPRDGAQAASLDRARPAGNQEKLRDVEDHVRLYQLIWNRFIACQMKPAVYDQTDGRRRRAARYGLRANGQVLKFAGYTAVYPESAPKRPARRDEGRRHAAAELNEGETLKLHKIDPEQHFTQPPPRFTEASLVKELEEKGIGRPSTYANILSTIQDRGYVEKQRRALLPDQLGTQGQRSPGRVVPRHPRRDFTAQMEDGLDQVEEGYGRLGEAARRLLRALQDRPRQGRRAHARPQARGDPDRAHVREVRLADGHQVGPQRRVPRVLAATPSARTPRSSCAGKTAPSRSRREPTDRREVRRRAARRCWSSAAASASSWPARAIPSARPRGRSRSASPARGQAAAASSPRSARSRGKVFYGCSNYSKTKCDFVLWDKPDRRDVPAVRRAVPGQAREPSRRRAHALRDRGLRLFAGAGDAPRAATARARRRGVSVQGGRHGRRRWAGGLRSRLAARRARPARLAGRAEAGRDCRRRTPRRCWRELVCSNSLRSDDRRDAGGPAQGRAAARRLADHRVRRRGARAGGRRARRRSPRCSRAGSRCALALEPNVRIERRAARSAAADGVR